MLVRVLLCSMMVVAPWYPVEVMVPEPDLFQTMYTVVKCTLTASQVFDSGRSAFHSIKAWL